MLGLCYHTITSKLVKPTTATAMEMRRGTTTCEAKLSAKCETLHTSEQLLQETRTRKKHWLLKTNAFLCLNTFTRAYKKTPRFHNHPDTREWQFYSNRNQPPTVSIYPYDSTSILRTLTGHTWKQQPLDPQLTSRRRGAQHTAPENIAVTGPAHASDWLVQTALF
jgi:hypothetical protein